MGRTGSSWSRFLALFGVSGLSGSEQETRDYLGQRLGLYFQILWIMYLIRYTGVALLGSIRGSTWQDLTSTSRLIHLGAVVFAFATARLTRSPRLNLEQLGLIDAAGTIAVGVAHAAALGFTAKAPTVELGMVLVFTQTLVARAAVVPSTASRTLAIGCTNLAMLIAAGYVAGRNSQATSGVQPWLWVYRICEWGGISLLLTAAISQVTYGLRRRFEQLARLGQYTLKEKIGEGGMGVVYRATHGMLRRPTAIKLLPPERAGARAIQHFEREVQITSTLVHPNTVAIYDFGRTPEGVFYYAMEYLDGIDLERLVNFDGPQPPGRVAHILKQVCAALGEAHSRGLIHRDVKPANVVLCERRGYSDFAKVVDFGLVKDLSPAADAHSVTMAQTFVGTPLYLAPEVVTGGTVDERSDLYSLGCLAYFLLTGRPVFRGATSVEICANHVHARVVPPSEFAPAPLSLEFEAIVLGCLEKEPGRRPDSAEALAISLEALQDVAPWNPADARAWWAERGSAARRSSLPGPAAAENVTLAVDLRARVE
jgi:serine/threonine-protein kinase